MFHPRLKMIHATFLIEDETFLLKERNFVLLFFILESLLTFLTCSYQIYTQQNKRQTQQLSDIQSHIHFFCNLRIFHKFQSKYISHEVTNAIKQ